ncbi:2-oxoglutarate and iron-dependent oxygenase domain-containing protein 2 isoform 3-T3 [Ciconia maguari]
MLISMASCATSSPSQIRGSIDSQCSQRSSAKPLWMSWRTLSSRTCLKVLLNELGMDETFITPLREKYLQPITALLYPDWGGACLDSHKAFVVKYSLHEDLDLSSHYDNAEVTLNVSLGKDFTEGNLYFGDFSQDPTPVPKYIEIEHVGAQGLLHRGGQIHGALPIASGERWNLIIWMRSSAIRNQLCPMCNKKPELVEAEGFGDGFTETLEDDAPETVNLCSLW